MAKKCLEQDCTRPAFARGRCQPHYWRHKEREEHASARDATGYPAMRLRWNRKEFDGLYESTPPAPWAMLFWQNMSIRAGRTLDGTYRYARRIGVSAKVDKSLRDDPDYRMLARTFRKDDDDDDWDEDEDDQGDAW